MDIIYSVLVNVVSLPFYFSEPFCIPLPPCILCHKYFCHIKRLPPYEQGDERFTDELDEV